MTEVTTNEHARPATRPFLAGLLAVVLLLDLLVVALALLSLQQSRQQYHQQAAVQAENLAQALESSIGGMIDTVDQSLQSVVDEAERELGHGGLEPEYFNLFVTRHQGRLPEVDGIHMANARGDVVYGTGIGSVSIKNIADRDYFIKVRDDRSAGLVISKPVVSRITGRWVIMVARRVSNPDGSFGGVIYSSMALQRFGDIFASFELGPNGGISLRDSDMTIMVRRPGTLGLASAVGQRVVSPELQGHLQAGETRATFFTEHGLENLTKTVSYRQIGIYPLYIIVALAARDYLEPWRIDQYRSWSLVAVFLVVTLVLSRVVYLRWRREKEAEHALRRSKDELEQRVAERTEQLFRSNAELTKELLERELAEERERQGHNMLLQIVDTIPQSVFWKDRNCIYLGCNTKFARRAGYASSRDVAGKSDFDLPWLREESQAYRLDDREVMESNRPKPHIIEQQLQADGSRVWVDTTKVPLCRDNGEVYGVLGVYEDITERKLIQESRDKALALFETVLSSSPTGIQVFDGSTGQCVIANQALADIVGGSVDGLLAQTFREIVSWRKSGLAAIAEQVLSDAQTRRVQRSLHTTFGKELDIDVFFSICEVQGRPHLMTIVVDITEIKRLEQENKRIEAQMLHVQKLESLGVLAGGIAHDFNNILMVVVGNADLAMSRLDPESPVYDNLVQIENAASRAADLARQMLAYSGKGRFVIEHLDVTRIVREMAQMIEVSISKKIALKYRFADPLPAVNGDATQLRQVVLNLVINASEAIGGNSGVITIATDVHDCDRSYLSDSWVDDHLPEGRYVLIEVSDTGCGIDRDIIPKIFDPFFTTKFTGRGLGMAAVLGIVRGHHGAIRVYSEKGKGSIFRVLIPAQESGTEQPAQVVDPAPLWQGRGTVLLVDDEESIRNLGQDMLRELGFTVVTARNGREALEIYGRRRKEIACVVLDLTMPELDGEQAFRELRRIDPEVRVIISSGYNEQEIGERLVARDMAAFIQKPYKLAEMSRKLQEVLTQPC